MLTFSPYGISILSGILLCLLVLFLHCKKRKISLSIFNLITPVYFFSFLGGKLLYIITDTSPESFFNYFNIEILIGGFSLLGASLGGIITLLFLLQKETKNTAIIPISVLLIHASGRIGCYLTPCCQGTFLGISSTIISYALYTISFAIGIYLIEKEKISSLERGILYYAFIVFLERFLLDPYRLDSLPYFHFLTKYQFFSLCYFSLVIFILFCFKNKHYCHK